MDMLNYKQILNLTPMPGQSALDSSNIAYKLSNMHNLTIVFYMSLIFEAKVSVACPAPEIRNYFDYLLHLKCNCDTSNYRICCV